MTAWGQGEKKSKFYSFKKTENTLLDHADCRLYDIYHLDSNEKLAEPMRSCYARSTPRHGWEAFRLSFCGRLNGVLFYVYCKSWEDRYRSFCDYNGWCMDLTFLRLDSPENLPVGPQGVHMWPVLNSLQPFFCRTTLRRWLFLYKTVWASLFLREIKRKRNTEELKWRKVIPNVLCYWPADNNGCAVNLKLSSSVNFPRGYIWLFF